MGVAATRRHPSRRWCSALLWTLPLLMLLRCLQTSGPEYWEGEAQSQVSWAEAVTTLTEILPEGELVILRACGVLTISS